MSTVQQIAALLPLGKLFDALFADALEPAARAAGAEIVRVPSEFSSESRLGAVCAAIEKADCVLADLTGRSPHILYQVGYAHGIGKKVLLLAAQGEDFPFDASRHPRIIHSGDGALLRAELTTFLSTGAMPAAKPAETPATPASADARAQFLEIFGSILAEHRHEHRGEVEMENPKTFILRDQDLSLALVQHLARRARELGLRLKLM